VNIVREITEEAPLREGRGERFDHCGYPDGRILLWGYPDRHVNHCCDPNAFELYEGDEIFVVARRDIGPGEEITFDYNINITGGDSWPCNCGANRCPGECTGDFFSLPDDQQREYLPFPADWFVQRYQERLEALGGD
jgi:hypothetical protein